MIQTVQMKIIARIHSDFDEKFGIPRQSGLVDSLRAKIVFEPEFRAAEAVRGLEGFSHVWLIWQFSQAVRKNWSPTVRPPRLGGNARIAFVTTGFHVYRAGAVAAAQGIDERKAVHAGHHDVGHDDVGTRLVKTAQPLDAVVGHRYVELLLAERVGDDVGERPLVLDKQHAYPIVHRREVSV